MNITIEASPTKETSVLVLQKNGAEYICKNEQAAKDKIKKLQEQYDRKISEGKTPRNPRAEISKITFLKSWSV